MQKLITVTANYLVLLLPIFITGCGCCPSEPVCRDKLKSVDNVSVVNSVQVGTTSTFTYDAQGRQVQSQAVDDTTHAIVSTTQYTYLAGSPNKVQVVITLANQAPMTNIITLNAQGLAVSDDHGRTTEFNADGVPIRYQTTINGIVTFADVRTVINGDVVSESRTVNNPDTFNEHFLSIPYCLDVGLAFQGKYSRHWPAIHLDAEGGEPVFYVYEFKDGKLYRRYANSGGAVSISTFTYY